LQKWLFKAGWPNEATAYCRNGGGCSCWSIDVPATAYCRNGGGCSCWSIDVPATAYCRNGGGCIS
jgi:hypothetical protein